jgi:hypothetical protein
MIRITGATGNSVIGLKLLSVLICDDFLSDISGGQEKSIIV